MDPHLQEDLAKRNIELETLLIAKERELEIEAALERVQSVAMSMKEPADMLEVCRIIALQLKALHVEEIRNVQTAIFYESKGTYMNYEYYAKHDKTFITETSFTNHTMHQAFAAKMLKGKGEFFTTHMSKEELPAWIAYQKTTNVFIDTYLETASSLSYYWYSLGPVALGISTYEPLSEEDKTLFKRFLNVFELSYTRYLDIERAIGQAREAQIQLALERVRARTMAMQKSEELREVTMALYEQLRNLGFLWGAASITIMDASTGDMDWWLEGLGDGFNFPERYHVPFFDHKSHIEQVENWKRGIAYAVIEVSKSEKKAFDNYYFTQTDFIRVPEDTKKLMMQQESVMFSMAYMHYGALSWSPTPITDEQAKILQRFAKVFEQTYTRFLDLQKAEAQAREARIEAALEKIRSTSLTMQHSDEIVNVVASLFEKLKEQDLVFDGGAAIVLFKEGSEDAVIGVVSPELSVPTFHDLPYDEKALVDNPIMIDVWKAKDEGIDIINKCYPFEQKNKYFNYVFKHNDESKLPAPVREFILNAKSYTATFIAEKNSLLGANSWTEQFFSEEDIAVLRRVARVFEQAYVRFLDLQKAEAQARESQIQLALERVRARTMAMQKSEELKEVAGLLFKQVSELGIKTWSTGFNVWSEDNNSWVDYVTNAEGGFIEPYTLDATQFPVFVEISDAKKRGDEFLVQYVEGEMLKELYGHLMKFGDKKQFEKLLEEGFEFPLRQFHHIVFGAKVSLMFITYEPVPEAHDIFRRFGKVFEQTYTRFLDLQKAEAQARESQIEAALEKVRSRSLAMHHSDELEQVAASLFERFVELGLSFDGAFIFLFKKETRKIELWIATVYSSAPHKIELPYDKEIENNAIIKDLWHAIENGDHIFNRTYSSETKNNYFRYAWKYNQAKVSESIKQLEIEKDWTACLVAEKNSIVGFDSWSGRLTSDEDFQILIRFAKVFDQAYVRFLDLQKAEAQARESQIQLALERVRARTMAMQKSDELPDAANILFQQVQSLGMPAWSAGYCTWGEDKKLITAWMSSEGVLQPPFKAPTTEDPSFIHMREASERGENFFVDGIGGEELVRHYQYMRTLPVVGEILDSIIEAGHPLPTFQIFHLAYFSQGFLLFITYEPVPEAHDIFKRFAIVFEQTYTRFLDLQKAEAQARESQIQLALERVRARTMAMQKSDELLETSLVLFEQFGQLGEAADQISIGIINEEEMMGEMSATVHGSKLPAMHKISLDEPIVMRKVYEAWKSQKKSFVLEITGEALAAYNKYRNSLIGQQVYPEKVDYTDRWIINAVFFSKGLLSFSSRKQRSKETIELLKRFAGVFDLTYTRFLDLKKAEEQAKEAQIEAALEKVRSRSLAVHKSDEFGEVVTIVFEKLQELKLPAYSTSINIAIDNSKDFKVYGCGGSDAGLTTLTYRLPYFSHPILNDLIHARETGMNQFSKTYSFIEKNSFYEYEIIHSELKNLPAGVKEKIFESDNYTITAALAKNSMILINDFDGKVLDEKQFDILNRFSRVFEQAYIRFLDLQKAEAQAREAQIQLSLERVRARAMAMYRSDELSEVLTVLFEQYDVLEVDPVYVDLSIIEPSANTFTWRCTGKAGQRVIAEQVVDLNSMDIWKDAVEKWRSGETHEVVTMFFPRAVLPQVFELFSEIRAKIPQDAIFTEKDFPDGLYTTQGFCKFGALGFGHNRKPTEEEKTIVAKFAFEFEQFYQRFLDLQKAEAQAREAQIEAALERVRSRTTGMQRSDELREVIQLVFEQLRQLGFNIDSAHFNLNYKESDDYNLWSAAPGQPYPVETYIPYFDHPVFIKAREAKEKGLDFFTETYTQEEKNKFFEHLFKNVPAISAERRKYILSGKGVAASTVLMNTISLWVMNYAGIPYTEAENAILKRFGKVFEQSHTRFLDLKKAEAQAREAQIEAALEKVRSRSLAMHKSDEMQDVVHTLFERLRELKIDFYTVIIIIFQQGSKDIFWWLENQEQQQYPRILLPYSDNPYLQDLFEAKESGMGFFSKSYPFAEKNEIFHYLFTDTDLKHVPEKQKEFLLESEFATMSVALAKKTGIHITSYSRKSFSQEENEILKRFAKVFDQAYTRFLDLQKAEAQAREAQIEAALERVRSSAMAMHKSEDLAKTAVVLFEQLSLLGNRPDRMGIGIVNEAAGVTDMWLTDQSGNEISSRFVMALDEKTTVQKMYRAWKAGSKSMIVDLTNDELKTWLDYVRTIGLEVKDKHFKNRRVQNVAFFSHGWLIISTLEPLPAEMMKILERFATVYSLTYRRFLDLQQAEAQAREAQIEAAMEKIRSRSLAMQKSDELKEVVAVVFEKLHELIKTAFDGVSILIPSEGSKDLIEWVTAEGKSYPEYFRTPYIDNPMLADLIKARESGVDFFAKIFEFEEKNVLWEHAFENSGYKNLPEEMKKRILESESYAYSVAFEKNSAIVVASISGKILLEKEADLLKRFTRTFEQAYVRFLDLQKAEANSRETVKQAALDRIRADIASMRTVGDLDRITPLIWNELNILGIPFIRCGVFLMDDAQQLIHTFLSAPDGRAIAAFHMPYDTPGKLSKVLSHWQQKKKYIDHWTENDFMILADVLVKQGSIANREEYMASLPHGGFYLHFLPFLQGMLYVGNTTQLQEEEIKLLQSVAAAFSTAYARYEDFNKLEAAKKQVDSTLNELQATQKQLIQSEKMASLGELTAGIAHEIQNPLNFVNNFSEVSNELIDEMTMEFLNGNADEALGIAEDLKQNLEKIKYHGKRADSIVKGMLQHSRQSSGAKEQTDINALCDEYVRLSYHGMRAKDKSFNAEIKTEFDENIGKINVVPQDIGRVLLNVINNAFYAVNEKKKNPHPLKGDKEFEPMVSVFTKRINSPSGEGGIEIRVKDNGNGIPQNIVDKIFQPFFTTKPTGQGTGLGLSLAYDIIKAHGGEIKVKSKEGEGSEFIIQLPT